MFERNLYKSLKSHLPERPATVITGMRRVGKSNLLKQLLEKIPGKNKIYLDLERIENRQIAAGHFKRIHRHGCENPFRLFAQR